MRFPKKAICQSVTVTVSEIIAGDQRKNVTMLFLSGLKLLDRSKSVRALVFGLVGFFFFLLVHEAQYLSFYFRIQKCWLKELISVGQHDKVWYGCSMGSS